MNCECAPTDNQGPQLYNFVCDAGDDFYRELQLIDEITAAPENINGWSFFCSIYESYAAKAHGDPALIQISNVSGFTYVDAVNGKLGMFIPSSKTGTIPTTDVPYGFDIPQNNCVYDIAGIDASNFKRVELRGVFTFQMRLSIV